MIIHNIKNLDLLQACTRFLLSVTILKQSKVEMVENKGLDYCLVFYFELI